MERSYSVREWFNEGNDTENTTSCDFGPHDSLASIAAKSSAYIVIFILSIVGNSLIIVHHLQRKRIAIDNQLSHRQYEYIRFTRFDFLYAHCNSGDS